VPAALRVPYTTSGFAAPAPPAVGWLTFDWGDLIWASITVGRMPPDQFGHGIYSSWEVVQRAGMIFAYLSEDPTGRIVPSPLYLELDRSEKGTVSYYIGMAMTKLFVDHLFNASWLAHIDRYQLALQVVFGPGRTRPDLVGPDPTLNWLVAEAKGRSGGRDQGASDTMKDQKTFVLSVAGAAPHVAMGCQAYFGNGMLALEVVDPTEPSELAVDYPLDPDYFFWAYYRSLVAIISQSGLEAFEDGRAQRLLRVPEADLTIQIDAELFDLVSRDLDEARGMAGEVLRFLANREVARVEQGDGLGVQLGPAWRGELRQGGSTVR